MSSAHNSQPRAIGRHLLPATLVAVLMSAAWASPTQAFTPIKLVPERRFGWDVNKTKVEKGGASQQEMNVCTVESGDECQPGAKSSEPGGFLFPEGVAVGPAPEYDVYVTDQANRRVQMFTSAGAFVRMFGWDVNKTKAEGGSATQQEKDVCTEEEVAKSSVVCQAGQVASGGPAGDIAQPTSIAVDQATTNLYVLDFTNHRIEEYTATGEFILTIGKKVNTDGTNRCLAGELTKCKDGEASAEGSTEPGAFKPAFLDGNLLTVGGSEDILYIGDEDRIQKFKANGESVGEIPLEPGGRAYALALDRVTGDLYLVYVDAKNVAFGKTNVIQRLDPKGATVGEPIEVKATEPGAVVHVLGVAIDAGGHLAMRAEQQTGTTTSQFGVLYGASTGHFLESFSVTRSTVTALAFGGQGKLYTPVDLGGQEVVIDKAEFVAELATLAGSCLPAGEHDTNVTLSCALAGTVNPMGVADTEVWFDWGKTPTLGTTTARQMICTSVCGNEPIGANGVLSEVAPDEGELFYKLKGTDTNLKGAEVEGCGERSPPSACEPESLVVPAVAPDVVGAPQASFIKTASAVMTAALNPENSRTEYFFEYAPAGEGLQKSCPNGVRHESCTGVEVTPTGQSSVYGKVGVTLEARGLQPNAAYHYRLFAESENLSKTSRFSAIGAENELTTAPSPLPTVQTGAYRNVTSTGALVTGRVDPKGVSVTYAFELGVYEGASTRYGIGSSGAVAANSEPVEETLALADLQPGTVYAYRIAISGGEIPNEAHRLTGETIAFATPGLPAALAAPSLPAILPTPGTPFPESPKGPSLTHAQKPPGTPKACKRKPRKRRALCERDAHKKHGTKRRGRKK